MAETNGIDCRQHNIAVANERRQKIRKPRGVDPTTCNIDYTEEEREFMLALDNYKRSRRRPFPTCREVLAVLLALGYRKAMA